MFSRILKLQICKIFHEILLSCSSSTYKVDVFDRDQSVVDLTVDLIKKTLQSPKDKKNFRENLRFRIGSISSDMSTTTYELITCFHEA